MAQRLLAAVLRAAPAMRVEVLRMLAVLHGKA
jgi:hypothetical protein